MDRYLEQHYKGRWRIRAKYDLGTNDWCRDHNGDLDDSFSDFFIDCKNNIEIKHGVGSILSCYIPSLQRGNSILRKIFIEKFDGYIKTKESINKENQNKTIEFYYKNKIFYIQVFILDEKIKTYDKCVNTYKDEFINKTLIEEDILLEIDVLDEEVYFTFKADLIDYIAKLVGARTSGASISPMSNKNLPKNNYTIPQDDLDKYNSIISVIPKRTVVIKDVSRTMIDGLAINRLVSGFDAVIQKVKGKKYDINGERKLTGLKGKDFVSSIGLWDKFLIYLEKEVKQYE